MVNLISSIQQTYDQMVASCDTNNIEKAVFLVYKDPSTRLYAGVTRPNSELIGLPGGKLEQGESIIDCLLRESKEEGWDIELNSDRFSILNQAVHNQKMIYWLGLDIKTIKPMIKFQESGRVRPVWSTVEEVSAYGHGNEFLLKPYSKLKNRHLAA